MSPVHTAPPVVDARAYPPVPYFCPAGFDPANAELTNGYSAPVLLISVGSASAQLYRTQVIQDEGSLDAIAAIDSRGLFQPEWKLTILQVMEKSVQGKFSGEEDLVFLHPTIISSRRLCLCIETSVNGFGYY